MMPGRRWSSDHGTSPALLWAAAGRGGRPSFRRVLASPLLAGRCRSGQSSLLFLPRRLSFLAAVYGFFTACLRCGWFARSHAAAWRRPISLLVAIVAIGQVGGGFQDVPQGRQEVPQQPAQS